MEHTCPVCGNKVDASIPTCTSCGYSFNGVTEKFKPLEIGGKTGSIPIAEAQSASFTIIKGQQVGTQFVITKDETTIGRSPQCDIFLNDMTVSREHAHVIFSQGTYIIKDAHSYNGVWVNNASVEQCPLHSGDIIQLGSFCLKFSSKH